MNYTYEIKNSDLHYETIIIEYLNDEFQDWWYSDSLKNKRINDFTVLHLRESFQRTKQWVLKNHPELLL